uniref:Uncharacterized protein n=1 Tax=Avena sativa TaxID=4498 RepID=A0ACD5ZMC6_AVESA
MLHSAPPLEVGASSTGHHRCLLRDVGGHGALLPADSSRLYGDDAATTKFLLERILRGSGIPPLPYSSSSAAAVHAEQREDPEVSASRFVPKSQIHGDDTSEASGAGTAPATALHRPVESTASSPAEGESAEREDSAAPASGFVPSGKAPAAEKSESSGGGSPPATKLHDPLESAEDISTSRLPTPQGPGGRIVIVANRLPVTARRNDVGQWVYDRSSGGLVSALGGIKNAKIVYVGWPGVSVPDKDDQLIITNYLWQKSYRPVFLDEDLMDQYYSGYCNNILWPLFHYMGMPQDCRFKKSNDFESQLKAYEKANEMFAEVVRQIHKEGDTIWCQDYHLMLLPMILRKSNINMKVGWFLHTPFPSYEIFRVLPDRVKLLESVIQADLVGFHTYDYARHFVNACTNLLGLDSCPQGIECGGRIVRVDAFPIGIDARRFGDALELHQVKEKITEFQNLFAGRKVMLGVDRLDMIKGFIQKLLAFEKFLEQNEDWKAKVVLLQIAVPTRSDVPEYRKLASQVHELVARVNGRFGTLKTTPILHLDQTLDFHTLCALYAVTDVALITSLRDGMNLVSYEYVACQESKKGVLILNEFAGAAQSLRSGAIIVNPWDITEVAGKIKIALNMSAVDREKWHKHNYEIVTTHTAQDWAQNFLRELNDTAIKSPLRTSQTGTALPIEEAAACYAQSKNRLLILNFGGYNMWLVAENGMFLRRPGKDWINLMPEHPEISWSNSVKNVFEYFRKRTPGSYSEERETSVCWNYKHADVETGRNQAKDLLQQLRSYSLSNQGADIVRGSQSIEVRPTGATKGKAVEAIINDLGHSKTMITPIDYVLCIGHFLAKDEDVYTLSSFDAQPGSTRKEKGWQADNTSIKFDLKPENYFPCTVGREHSIARYKLEGTNNVVCLLQDLAVAAPPANISNQPTIACP